MPCFHINRSNILARYLIQQGWRGAAADETADFAMWFPYEGDERRATISLFDRKFVSQMDDKLTMYQMLQGCGYKDLMPPTFVTLPDYLRHLKQTAAPVSCYLKFSHSTAGDGVYYFNRLRALLAFLDEHKYDPGAAIIQQDVPDGMLLDGRKFKIRAYVLILKGWHGFVYREALTVRNERALDPTSDDAAMHISSDSGDQTGLIRDLPGAERIMEELRQSLASILACFRGPYLSQAIEGDYQLFGFDYICDLSDDPYLIEINGFPNLERQDAVGHQLARDMLCDLKTLVIDPLASGAKPATGGFVPVSPDLV